MRRTLCGAAEEDAGWWSTGGSVLMSELALDEAYRDELLVVLRVTLCAIPFAQLFILQQMLTNKNNTSARG